MVAFAQHYVQFGSMYSPLYILSTFLWNIFNSDNVLGTYIYGFKSYSLWLSSNCFLIQKRFIIQNKSNGKSFATNIFSVAKKVWMQQFYFIATSYCHNSILYQYILLPQKLTDAIVVNNIDQYVVVSSFFCCELASGCKNNCCHHICFHGNIIYYN